MKTYLKFGSLIVVILVTLGLIAKSSITETSSYYKTIADLQKMTKGKDHRLRVGGTVTDSIVRHGKEVQFTQKGSQLMFTGLPSKAPDDPVTVIAAECEAEPVQDSLASRVIDRIIELEPTQQT